VQMNRANKEGLRYPPMKKLNLLAFASVCLLCIYIFVFSHALIMDAKSEVKAESTYGMGSALFYAVGQVMISSGKSANPYDTVNLRTELEKVLERTIDQPMAWPYPPMILLLWAPLALFPYYIALFLWLSITFSLFCIAIYKLVPNCKQIALLACGFPGVFMNLSWGQNGFLNTALLGFGLYFMNTRPVISGLMFGLLTYKPNLAFVPFLLLLLTKKWPVLLWSMLFATVTAIVSGLVFGFDQWILYMNTFLTSSAAPLAGSTWETTSMTQVSVYSALRLAGVELQYVSIITIITAITVTVAAWMVWQKTELLTLQGAALVISMFLIIPYARLYDLALLALPLVLLAYDCRLRGCHPFEIVILILLWTLPFLTIALAYTINVQICPIVLLLVLVMILIRAKANRFIHSSNRE